VPSSAVLHGTAGYSRTHVGYFRVLTHPPAGSSDGTRRSLAAPCPARAGTCDGLIHRAAATNHSRGGRRPLRCAARAAAAAGTTAPDVVRGLLAAAPAVRVDPIAVPFRTAQYTQADNVRATRATQHAADDRRKKADYGQARKPRQRRKAAQHQTPDNRQQTAHDVASAGA
jgi:hypothetical protein